MTDPTESRQPDLFEILQAEGVLTVPAAAALRQRTSDRWTPLGKILRQKGWLSMAQLMELLDLQSEEPAVRIGALAVRAGICTREQVDAALELQHKLSPHPLEVLLQDASVDRVRLAGAIVRYVRLLEALGDAPSPSPGAVTPTPAPPSTGGLS